MTDASRLRSFVERIENIESEIKDRNSDKRDIYAEAKAAGFDPQGVKDAVAYRRNPDKASNRSARCDEYVALLGSGLASNNAPARNSGAMEGIAARPSRARAQGDGDDGIPAFLDRTGAPA